MTKWIFLTFCGLLAGCASGPILNGVALGMNREQVIREVGKPAETAAIQGVEVWTYYKSRDFNDAWSGARGKYQVVFRSGRVAAYGTPAQLGAKPVPTLNVNVNNRVHVY